MNVKMNERANSWGIYPFPKGTTTSVLALKGLPRKRKRRRAGHRVGKRRM